MSIAQFYKLLGIRKRPKLVVSFIFGTYAWMLENKTVKVYGNSQVECYCRYAQALIDECGLTFERDLK